MSFVRWLHSRHRDRLAARRDERGVSVVELVAVLAILGVVTATVFQGTWSSSIAIDGANERLENLAEARLLMASASKDVRTAVRLSAGTSPFALADGNETIFFANLDTVGAPKKVRISIDANDQLLEEVWTADAGSVAPNYTYTGAPRVRLVGRYVDNDAARPMFEYLDASDAVLGPLPLSAANRLAVRAVRITLVVKKETVRRVAATTLVNRVRLPNLDYNEVGA